VLGREGGLGGGVSVELLKVIKDERRRHHRRKYDGSPILRLPVLLLQDLLNFTLLVSSIDFDLTVFIGRIPNFRHSIELHTYFLRWTEIWDRSTEK